VAGDGVGEKGFAPGGQVFQLERLLPLALAQEGRFEADVRGAADILRSVYTPDQRKRRFISSPSHRLFQWHGFPGCDVDTFPASLETAVCIQAPGIDARWRRKNRPAGQCEIALGLL
jgi:hypothetical protein